VTSTRLAGNIVGERMIGADEIADALDLPRPTPQQKAIIEAPVVSSLVIAGAGSGKTETMAGRVVWLLANGKVRPSGILGLTFTRKAAGELLLRVRERVAAFADLGLALPTPATERAVQDGSGPDGSGHDSWDIFESPTISTYNSFASALHTEHAVSIGREPEARVLSEASAWQLARRTVIDSVDPRLVGFGRSLDNIIEAMLDLSRTMAENLVDPAAVTRMAEQFALLLNLPPGGKKTTPYADVLAAVELMGTLPPLVEMGVELAERKIAAGAIEFSDQVALALQICRQVPGVVESYRERYPVVLLDEYQDTSVVQTALLSTLFGGSENVAVTAVGDPHQSIYGWRGASASNLARFGRDFGRNLGAGSVDVPVHALSTSWRNPSRILAAANLVAAPLTAGSAVRVERLEPRPDAPAGRLDVAYDETVALEADRVAAWLKDRLEEPASQGQAPTAAVLMRSLRKSGVFTRALDAHGVPYVVLGLGGLLEEPAVADLVCALKVIGDPTAGSFLIRLLAGARWRLGVADIAALRGVARWLVDRDYRQQRLSEDVSERVRRSVAVDENASLIDALDFVASRGPGSPDGGQHSQLAAFTEEGIARLRDLGSLIAGLRGRVGLALPDLVTVVEQELQLDIEVAANDTSTSGRASLDAFVEHLVDFAASDPSAGLASFLDWLDLAEERDRLSVGEDDPKPGTVQVLTIHKSKGLEWDIVVLPRMAQDELPEKIRSKQGWLSFGALPYEFRGDALDLPTLNWRGAATQKEFLDAKGDFELEVAARHLEEQRRLAYVAITRSRRDLLLTGSFWSTQKNARPPGVFLHDLEDGGLLDEPLPEAPEAEENPLEAIGSEIGWPRDPLGARRDRVEAAAAAVRSADPAAPNRWSDHLDVLIRERNARRAAANSVELPVRISASRFKDYISSPGEVAGALRRPMPERPYRQTRLGTVFHGWVEQRAEAIAATDVVDGLPDDSDLEPDDFAESADLDRLKEIFERSEWAALAPSYVELEIHLPFAGQIVVCKIDAVYRRGERWEIVDWKTGAPPKGTADYEQKQYQLALYRLALSRYLDVPLAEIDAAFYYVSEDLIIRPEALLTEQELEERWHSAVVD